MARHNDVTLLGQVRAIRINYDNETPVKAMMSLNVMRRANAKQSTDGVTKTDTPVIFTTSREQIARMESIKSNDIVLISGVLSTLNRTKPCYCPKCKGKTDVEGCLFTYVTPINIIKIQENASEAEAYATLRENTELSNIVRCIGTLCRDVDFYAGDELNQTSMARYQIAVNRHFRIYEDAEESRTDYPFVISRGKQAVADSKALHINSTVFIRGSLETRPFNRNVVCAICGNEYASSDNATQLVPYNVEYLIDCEKPEPTRQINEGE